MINNRIRIEVTAVVVMMAAVLVVAAVASSIPVQKALAYSDPNESTVLSLSPGTIKGIDDPTQRIIR